MCGIFGIISPVTINKKNLSILSNYAQQRGKDSSGILMFDKTQYQAYRADYQITKLLNHINIKDRSVILGHSRLITNGLSDNQPVIRENICVFHNGIVVNHDHLWKKLKCKKNLQIDTEIIVGIAIDVLSLGKSFEEIPSKVLSLCKGVVACAIALPQLGKLILFSNNGSLYLGQNSGAQIYSSEKFPLTQIGCKKITQVRQPIFIDIPKGSIELPVQDQSIERKDLLPSLGNILKEERMLKYRPYALRRCSYCILPETMPYINFDDKGVCNYCKYYIPRNKPRPLKELLDLVEPYRRKDADECIVPFSGGRDSCYSLHLIAKELKLKPITYTYDWGMVTDLGRRNISRMCAELGVENIIIADDIRKKRYNIAMNLKAWLKSPHLGMISILTAGDKHFFRHVETIKKQTEIKLNIWGINPLEVTHFKSGFLGIPPNFDEKNVYSLGIIKQLRYQILRFRAMTKSIGYFNTSLWDTLSGEYYRSFIKKSDYFHLFDFWPWNEKQIDHTLATYDWEKAKDTNTTWRIGDGTAAFYNYIYYTVAGFTEHDTFRSNQIREGDMTRDQALDLVNDENRPRYSNIKWYLDSLGVNFDDTIKVINSIKSLY
jgi:glucosamine--fructose-6-phosphate aminotransferase (isomerizing)